MKSLILKDIYNIGHNLKSMLFIFIVFAFVFIPLSGAQNYIFICAILCSMMIVTTFSFDDASKWNRYALITPVSKKDLVAAKFIALFLFCAAGAVFGFFVGTAGSIIAGKLTLTIETLSDQLFSTLAAILISMIFGSMSIPLVFRFGAERGRILLLVSFLVPAAICFGVYQLLLLLNIQITDTLIFALICLSPVLTLLWSLVMYRISCAIFDRQEL